MTDLTEQWKKGELTGEYWCEITESPYPERVYLPTCDSDIIVKVLAPVPSYEEFQNLKEYEQTILSYNMKPIDYEIACETVNKLLDERKALKEENAQLKEEVENCEFILKSRESEIVKLKELLKECREFYQKMYSLNIINSCSLPLYDDLKKRINQVLGEDR